MPMLHTVNKSPFERNTLSTCLQHALPGSSVLLFEDGVYAAVSGTAHSAAVQAALANRSVYVLGPDLRARGMDLNQIIDGIQVVDYEGFVDLTVAHDNVQSWV
jgi:tRNA 2-thiouridine synthesizing protein B